MLKPDFSNLLPSALQICHEKDAKILGINIQEFVTNGKEMIIGMKRDPQFGPLLMFGLGGIYVEIIKDVPFRLAVVLPDMVDKIMYQHG